MRLAQRACGISQEADRVARDRRSRPFEADRKRYFRKRDGQHFNVHFIARESPKWRANLRFRDYLRSNDDAAQRYSEAKRANAVRAPTLLAWEIYVMNANGSGERRLTRIAALDGGKAWSPDGRKIAFVAQRDGNFDVYVLKLTGAGSGG